MIRFLNSPFEGVTRFWAGPFKRIRRVTSCYVGLIKADIGLLAMEKKMETTIRGLPSIHYIMRLYSGIPIARQIPVNQSTISGTAI